MSVNNTGKFTSVSGLSMDYDEPTGKFILSIQAEIGILQLKLSEADSLSFARMIIECIWRTKSLYNKEAAENLK